MIALRDYSCSTRRNQLMVWDAWCTMRSHLVKHHSGQGQEMVMWKCCFQISARHPPQHLVQAIASFRQHSDLTSTYCLFMLGFLNSLHLIKQTSITNHTLVRNLFVIGLLWRFQGESIPSCRLRHSYACCPSPGLMPAVHLVLPDAVHGQERSN